MVPVRNETCGHATLKIHVHTLSYKFCSSLRKANSAANRHLTEYIELKSKLENAGSDLVKLGW